MKFTEPIDEYIILKIRPADYSEPENEPPDGYRIISGKECRRFRKQEKGLLRETFDRWQVPYYGLLPGFGPGSRIFLLHGQKLMGGVYVCDRNELGEPDWGQLHYVWVHPDCQGKGLYRFLFRDAIRTIKRNRIEGLYLNSDRHLLPEVYERWGAVPFRRITKKPPAVGFAQKAGESLRVTGKLFAIAAQRLTRR